MADNGGKIDLTDEQFHDFLTKLSEDDEFRAAVQEDPVGTLAKEGVHIPREEVPDRVKLPPKEELRGRIGSYVERKKLGTLDQIPHHLVGGECEEDDMPKPPWPKPPKP